ncbi:OLC1v1013569C1 [Oldenlandia corymbosa var. corymbosa]|uniref:OLC1v1013569C1 n=1 Tax=Oldenlandia corymbosa var. corymbosa TaxID=529605 RepID=A0AAV1E0P9_OLDCO|nr:OLC1v1013569C1 [Oldenlandia corymbosa var. corymbosa]
MGSGGSKAKQVLKEGYNDEMEVDYWGEWLEKRLARRLLKISVLEGIFLVVIYGDGYMRKFDKHFSMGSSGSKAKQVLKEGYNDEMEADYCGELVRKVISTAVSHDLSTGRHLYIKCLSKHGFDDYYFLIQLLLET